jgi:hypothetical protein
VISLKDEEEPPNELELVILRHHGREAIRREISRKETSVRL